MVELVFDTGERRLVAQLGLIGRKPVADQRYPGAELLAVKDPANSISATHLAFEADGDQLWVTDLGSTNGTQIIEKSGRARALTARVRTAVPAEARIVLGKRTMRANLVGWSGWVFSKEY
ncbi:MAG: FHA domain-containing protein [Propionibacteriaceae bacterium]|jgi:pSer/pThr/pTyr-binding forkhead associated (FHA) protein|nr:FHA domain-containing protein [Propionibacteriaceae bacterium]